VKMKKVLVLGGLAAVAVVVGRRMFCAKRSMSGLGEGTVPSASGTAAIPANLPVETKKASILKNTPLTLGIGLGALIAYLAVKGK